MGLLRAVQRDHAASLEEITRLVFDWIWKDNRIPTTREDLSELASSFVTGEQLQKLLDNAVSKPVRHLLRDEAKALVEDGAFGFPWMVAHRASDQATYAT